jgi:hypothetical protein
MSEQKEFEQRMVARKQRMVARMCDIIEAGYRELVEKHGESEELREAKESLDDFVTQAKSWNG